MSNSRRVAKNFFSLTIAEVVSRLLGALLSFYIARELGANVFGQFSFAIAFISFFNIFVDLGLTQLAVRDIAQDKTRTSKYGTNIVALQLVISGFLTLLLVSLLLILPLDYTTKVITFFFGLGMIPLALNMQYILQAHERMEFMAISRVVGQVGYALLGFGIIYVTRDVIWLPLAQFSSALIWAITAFYFIKKYIHFDWEKVEVKEIKRLARLSMPFFIAAMAGQIYYNIDSILIQFMRGSEDVGIYNAGYKIVLLILMVSSFAIGAFFPLMSSAWVENKQTFNKVMHFASRIMGALSLPLAIGGILLAPQLIEFIYKRPEYLEATHSFQILLLLPVLVFFNILLGSALIAALHQKKNTIATVVGAIVNIILNFILIPYYGIVGAAIATVAAELGVLLYLVPHYYKVVNVPVIMDYFFKPLIASVVMGAAVLYLAQLDLSVVTIIIIAGIIYAIGLILLGAVNIKEITSMLRKQPSA